MVKIVSIQSDFNNFAIFAKKNGEGKGVATSQFASIAAKHAVSKIKQPHPLL